MSTPTLHAKSQGWPGLGGGKDDGANDISVDAALAFMLDSVAAGGGEEAVALRAARGRVLASDLISPIDVPAHDNSAMDGYAFNGTQLGTAPLQLRVAGLALAGQAFQGYVDPGCCVRIMTGAVMPAGCDTVIPQELVLQADDTCITIAPDSVRAGDNRRRRGEDLALGLPALPAGRVLRAADLGLAASLGIAQLSVKPRLRVACFSTGDELYALGETLAPGCIYDSNRYSVGALLEEMGCEVIDLGIVRDDPRQLEAVLHKAADADAIVTSGGASSGDADHTVQVMARLGEVLFWRMAMRPGRPFAFGRIAAGTDSGPRPWLFGLPGNPVAAMISFLFLVRPVLRKMMGSADSAPMLVPAIAQSEMRKRPGRTEYQRAVVERDGARLLVRLTGAQGSGILRSMSEANAIVILPAHLATVRPGDSVEVLLLD